MNERVRFEEVSRDIQSEIDTRMQPFRSVISVSGLISMILLFQVFLKYANTNSVQLHF